MFLQFFVLPFPTEVALPPCFQAADPSLCAQVTGVTFRLCAAEFSLHWFRTS